MMLPETEKILTKFRELNRNSFYEIARDFLPEDSSGRRGGAYRSFNEEGEIYSLMYALHLQLDEQEFRGNYDNAYASPIEPVTKLIELNDYLKGHIQELEVLNKKYAGRNTPVRGTLDSYIKTQITIEHVLNLNEIKSLGDYPKLESLKEEVIELKAQQAFRQRKNRILARFIFYLFCLFIPVIVIAVLWSDHKNGKWFQLGLFLFPLFGFLYSKSSFIEIFKFTLSKKYRGDLKSKLKGEISKNYR